MTIKYETMNAVRIGVNVEGTTEQYAVAFLAIYNNVKEYSELLKMYNDYNNGIYLVCETEAQNDTIRFLKQFGEITTITPVKAIQPYVNNRDYSGEYEIEILNVEE